MNKTYRLINNSLGWLLGIIASAVYVLTAEPTMSWWDCGEYIATAHKLLVGHPPGAPTFQIIGAVFSQFAGNDPAMVGYWVNVMSALCSGFGIMFLFWTITLFGKKLVNNLGGFTPTRTIAVFAAGIVGALTYTFTDSYWFSAVEGEVYSMSSFFTALVFWCILKWDEEYETPKPNTNPQRWLILIFYLIGLSVGVHLLNLLTLPAIGLIIYFRLSKNASYKGIILTFTFFVFAISLLYNIGTMFLIWVLVVAPLLYVSFKNGSIRSKAEWGVMGALVASAAVVGFILWAVIPGIVNWAGKVEIFCKNSLGLPFNAGTIIYFLIIFGATGYAIYYGYKKKKQLLKICAYSFLFFLFGYSTFLTLVIRSNANPTIDENSPKDAVSLLSYLNREQYGSTPLLYGQSYNTRLDRRQPYKDGTPVYVRSDKEGKYIIADNRKESEPNYDSNQCMFIPRMYSYEKADTYLQWMRNNVYNSGSISDRDNMRSLDRGNLPTMEQNKDFLHSYQLRFMYWRYFMWNFVGRQNEVQCMGDYQNGNWVSGIPFVDNKLVGKQQDMPSTMKFKGHNTYYFLPLILGIIGLIYYSRRDLKNSFVVFMLFLMTGWAIAFYLNNSAFQPRERDYAYAASFYAFSIWIGFGVFALIALLEKWKNKKGKIAASICITLICIGLVPGIMGKENWDDHDRSHRYVARDMGYNYLDTVDENGIIYTNGDNDTFPLWYAQEVEGFRTDVRVCNLSYLQTDWYIDQMKRKSYKSDPLPFSLTHDQYVTGTRDYVYLLDRIEGYVDLKEAIKFLASENPRTKQIPGYNGRVEHLPSTSFMVPADSGKIMKNKMVSERYAHLIDSVVKITLNKDIIVKNELMVLDLLANNDWNRTVYMASSVGSENYVGLEKYFQLEGFGYQIVPIHGGNQYNRWGMTEYGRVDADKMYYNVMNKYRYDGFNDPRVYLDENHIRMAYNIRNNMTRLATTLLDEGRTEMAVEVLDKAMEVLPSSRIPHNFFSLFIMDVYYEAGEFEKADEIAKDFAEITRQELDYFTSLKPRLRKSSFGDIQRSLGIYFEILETVKRYEREELQKNIDENFEKYSQRLRFFDR